MSQLGGKIAGESKGNNRCCAIENSQEMDTFKMSSLYSELFCHQPSLARTPTEDFLTQALADLLNRLQSASPEAHRCFVKEAFLAETSLTEEQRSNLMEVIKTTKLKWGTQITAVLPNNDTRRLDLVLECDGKPLIGVENKIDANYTPGQLSAYCEWLRDRGWPDHVLVLLTRWTPPPVDFLEDTNESYTRSPRAVCWWRDVYLWLKEDLALYAPSGVNKEFGECVFLASEFCRFLEEELTVNNTLTMADFAFLQLSLRPIEVAQSLVREIRLPHDIKERFQETKNWVKGPKIFAGSSYSKLTKNQNDWWVGWGLIIESGDLDGFPLDVNQPTAFSIVGSDSGTEKQRLPIRQLQTKEDFPDWKFEIDPKERPGYDYAIKKITVAELLGKDPNFEKEYRDWTDKRLKEAAKMLEVFAKSLNG